MNHQESLKVVAVGDREIVITRTLAAPRELAWEALTRPELLRRWLNGPPGWETTECENDLRVGGAFRHAWAGPGGVAMAMHGVYSEIVAPQRMVRTEAFEIGCEPQGAEKLASLVLTAVDGGRATEMRITLLFQRAEDRDAMLASGMEHGMAASYRELDDVLADRATAG